MSAPMRFGGMRTSMKRGTTIVSAFQPPMLTIDGAAVRSIRSLDVVNPALGEPFASAPDASREQLDAAFEAAARAFRTWRADDEARRAVLHAMADAIAAAEEEIAPILTAEQGKPLAHARLEVRGAAGWLRYYADFERRRQVLRDDESARVEVVHAPIGPVATIVPWNFPIYIAAAKFAAALRAGNTVVLKPSPYTPLATLKLGEIVRDLLPPGVFNVISGSDELGPAMSAHPLARKISFTGSVATGKKVAAAAADDLKRLTLELGGNDPAIVLEDADPGAVAEQIFATAFFNNGQVCVAPKRIYAADAVRPALVEALAERARAAKVGDGADAGTEPGPMNNALQRSRVAELVEDAVDQGATVVAGGRRIEGPGYFYEPTILTDVSDGVRIVDEEQFGPALPVIGIRDDEDALDRANGTMFGLGASVWSGDPDRAAALAERVEAGMTWVNTHNALAFDQPFTGVKWSGVGVEAGEMGLDAYTDDRVLYRAK